MPVKRFQFKDIGKDKIELAKRNADLIFNLTKKRKETQSQRRIQISLNKDTLKAKTRARSSSVKRESFTKSSRIKRPVKFVEDNKEIKDYPETVSTQCKETRKKISENSSNVTRKSITDSHKKEYLYEGRRLSLLSRSSVGVTPANTTRPSSTSKKHSLPLSFDKENSTQNLKRKRDSLDGLIYAPKRLHPKIDNY